MTVIQNHELNIAEHRFQRIIVRASFRQTNPMQVQRTHRAARRDGLTRMGAVLIQHNPDILLGIPATHLLHEAAHTLGILRTIVAPAYAPALHIIERKEIEPTARLLTTLQDQPLRGAVAPTAIVLDDHRLDIKEEQDAVRRQMQKDSANTG